MMMAPAYVWLWLLLLAVCSRWVVPHTILPAILLLTWLGVVFNTMDKKAKIIAKLEKLTERLFEENDKHVDTSMSTMSDHLAAAPPMRPDCPICMVPMPLDIVDTTYMACCGNTICTRCYHDAKRVVREANRERSAQPVLEYACAFCRSSMPATHKEYITQLRGRMKRHDAEAIWSMACYYRDGEMGVQKDELKALELLHRAAVLGSLEAYNDIGVHFESGTIVEKDLRKARMYLFMAAKKGHLNSSLNLDMIKGAGYA